MVGVLGIHLRKLRKCKYFWLLINACLIPREAFLKLTKISPSKSNKKKIEKPEYMMISMMRELVIKNDGRNKTIRKVTKGKSR